MDFVKDPMFCEIISLYSTMDLIQVIDPQGLQKCKKTSTKTGKPLFSFRKFDPSPNLKQVKIKIDGRGILHTEFLAQRFLAILPKIVTEIESLPDNDYLLCIELV